MRYLKTVIITLMFIFTNSALAAPGFNKAGKESTLRGTVVKLDKEKGTGILKEEYTNRLVTFRFADELKENLSELPRAGTVVEFTYIKNNDNIAATE